MVLRVCAASMRRFDAAFRGVETPLGLQNSHLRRVAHKINATHHTNTIFQERDTWGQTGCPRGLEIALGRCWAPSSASAVPGVSPSRSGEPLQVARVSVSNMLRRVFLFQCSASLDALAADGRDFRTADVLLLCRCSPHPSYRLVAWRLGAARAGCLFRCIQGHAPPTQPRAADG